MTDIFIAHYFSLSRYNQPMSSMKQVEVNGASSQRPKERGERERDTQEIQQCLLF